MTEEATLDANTDGPIDSSQLELDTATPESESSPAPVEPQEEKDSDPFQKRINKVTADKYEQQRRADGLEAEVAELRARVNTPTPAAQVEAPKPPSDMYDQEAVQQYHQDMVAYQQQLAEVAGNNAYERQQQQQKEQARNAEVQQAVSTFANNAIRDGVDIDKLRVAEQDLVQSGITPELGSYLMNDQNGGKIVEYLHDNPALKFELLALDPVSAGVRIEAEVKAKALASTPKVSNAPAPIPEITGGGMIDKDDFDRANPGTVFI